MNIKSKKICMFLYGEIEHDGRVQRAAEALGRVFEVIVFSVDSGKKYKGVNFAIKYISLPNIKLKLFKILRHLGFWLKVYLKVIKFHPSAIYAHDYFTIFPSYIISYLLKVKIIYDSHELIMPDKSKRQRLSNLFWYLLEKCVINRIDMIITANNERANIMQNYYNLKKKPIIIRNIPRIAKKNIDIKKILCVYPQLLDIENNSIKIVYQGSITLERGIDKFILAMKYLKCNFKLLLIGSGPDIKIIKQLVKNNGLNKQVFFLGKIPIEHVFSILKICEIGVVTYSYKGLNNIYCAPNKIYEYAQAGLPIITTCQPTLKNIIGKYKIGILINKYKENNNEIFAKNISMAIMNLADNSEKYRKNIPKFIQDHKWSKEQKVLIDTVIECVKS